MRKPTKRVTALMRLNKKQLVAKVIRSEQMTLLAQDAAFKAQQHAFNAIRSAAIQYAPLPTR